METITPTTKGINLKVKVLSSDIVVTHNTLTNKTKLAEVLVGDDTACILFSARNSELKGYSDDLFLF